MAVKPLQLAIAVCVGLLFGTLIGYTTKPIPEPDVRVKALLSPPFVEVTVNGKAVNLGKIRLVPEQQDKKKKSGDIGEVGEVVRPAAYFSPASFQRDGRQPTEWLGLDRVVDKLIAWLADKGKETEAALARREEVLSAGWSNFKVAAIVGVSVIIIPLGWIGFSLQRIADHAVKVA
jgi:hypothetical protein